MTRSVRDFIEVADHLSLDELIERLTEIRDSLPGGAEPELKIRGDEIFGRHLCIAFQRPATAEEVECDARYANAYRETRQRQLARLQDEIGYCSLADSPHDIRKAA